MAEEDRKNIKDRVLRINNLFHDLQIRFAVLPSSLAVPRFHDRRSENMLHLGSSLLQRRQRTLDEDFSCFQRNLCGSPRLELRQFLERWPEIPGDIPSI